MSVIVTLSYLCGSCGVSRSADTEPDRYDMNELPGKPPGPSRTETIYASHLACCRACVAPSAEAQICLSATSEMTVDWEGDGRIREEFKSLGGR